MGLFANLFGMGPKSAQDYYTRGITYCHKGEYDKAIEDLTKAIRLDPKFAMAYNNRGYAWLYKGEYDKAIADYSEANRSF